VGALGWAWSAKNTRSFSWHDSGEQERSSEKSEFHFGVFVSVVVIVGLVAVSGLFGDLLVSFHFGEESKVRSSKEQVTKTDKPSHGVPYHATPFVDRHESHKSNEKIKKKITQLLSFHEPMTKRLVTLILLVASRPSRVLYAAAMYRTR
jgi:hypothetical protein